MAAAPADYRPARAPAAKTPRAERRAQTLDLEPTDDILLDTVARRKPGAVIVGFALETGDAVAKAREPSCAASSLDLVVANDATEPGAGPEVATNRVTLVAERTARTRCRS